MSILGFAFFGTCNGVNGFVSPRDFLLPTPLHILVDAKFPFEWNSHVYRYKTITESNGTYLNFIALYTKIDDFRGVREGAFGGVGVFVRNGFIDSEKAVVLLKSMLKNFIDATSDTRRFLRTIDEAKEKGYIIPPLEFAKAADSFTPIKNDRETTCRAGVKYLIEIDDPIASNPVDFFDFAQHELLGRVDDIYFCSSSGVHKQVEKKYSDLILIKSASNILLSTSYSARKVISPAENNQQLGKIEIPQNSINRLEKTNHTKQESRIFDTPISENGANIEDEERDSKNSAAPNGPPGWAEDIIRLARTEAVNEYKNRIIIYAIISIIVLITTSALCTIAIITTIDGGKRDSSSEANRSNNGFLEAQEELKKQIEITERMKRENTALSEKLISFRQNESAQTEDLRARLQKAEDDLNAARRAIQNLEKDRDRLRGELRTASDRASSRANSSGGNAGAKSDPHVKEPESTTETESPHK
jgi:hypothetical protein